MAPINLPDGSQVSEIVLPDGSTASEVLAPDGSTVFSGIPDSQVQRTADNNSVTTSTLGGLRIESDDEWPEIDGRISNNTSGASRAYVYRVSDGQLLGDTDISSLTAGDVFTVQLSPAIQPSDGTTATKYNFALDNEGNSYTFGYYDNKSVPIISNDGNLRIIDGAKNKTGTDPNLPTIDKVGNLTN